MNKHKLVKIIKETHEIALTSIESLDFYPPIRGVAVTFCQILVCGSIGHKKTAIYSIPGQPQIFRFRGIQN